eukprot:15115953-Alexandrium_andersonii.AAC.1
MLRSPATGLPGPAPSRVRGLLASWRLPFPPPLRSRRLRGRRRLQLARRLPRRRRPPLCPLRPRVRQR